MNIKAKDLTVRQLDESENVPFNLLLLADETIEAINRYLPFSRIYTAYLGGTLVGVYLLKAHSEKEAEIMNIAVLPEMQGKGIGTLLLEDAEQRAKAAGYDTLLIATGDAGIRQLNLYQKVGFEQSEIRWNFFIDNYPEPIFENGIQLRHMVVLKKQLGKK